MSFFRNDSGSDRSPSSSRAPSGKSRVDSAAERLSRRMSYIPPRLRKNSINKSAPQNKKPLDSKNLKTTTDEKDKNISSAMSKRSVKNFDDKKYRSNSHLTPVDW